MVIPLAEAWAEGPQHILGWLAHGFPNLLTITGPGSPSVLTNMPRAIEQHIDWITTLLRRIKARSMNLVEAELSAMQIDKTMSLRWQMTHCYRGRAILGIWRERAGKTSGIYALL